jgi:hypothetical protein
MEAAASGLETRLAAAVVPKPATICLRFIMLNLPFKTEPANQVVGAA